MGAVAPKTATTINGVLTHTHTHTHIYIFIYTSSYLRHHPNVGSSHVGLICIYTHMNIAGPRGCAV